MRTYQKHATLSIMLCSPRNSLPIPCKALGREKEFPAIMRESTRKALILQGSAPEIDKISLLFPWRQGRNAGSGVGPAIAFDSAARLDGEVFGPILHVVRWHADRLDEIAATGYRLTLGIHSRIDETVRHILGRLRVGRRSPRVSAPGRSRSRPPKKAGE